MADDATSVPGSLFGNLPINQGNDQQRGNTATPLGDDDEQSYVDFYARLGTNRNAGSLSQEESTASISRRLAEPDDLEASLLGGGHDAAAASSRFDLLSPTSNWFAKNRKRVNFIIAGTVVIMIIVMLWWVTGGGRTIEPPAWKPAPAYQVSFVMTLASGLEEPGVAMVDSNAQAMRVSYYSGMTTFIMNETGPSWSIVPRIDKLTCFVEGGVKLQSIFPDFSKFHYVRQRDLVLAPRGAKAVGTATQPPSSSKKKKSIVTTCEEWTYSSPADTKHLNDSYVGTYTLWTTPGADGFPVRFQFVGRNVILGSSHYDNYTIDYYNYRDLTAEDGGIDPIWFQPPKGMPCRNVTESGGPTKAADHARNLALLFPENEEERQSEYDAFHKLYSVKEKSEGRNVIFQQTLRLIQAHNRDTSRSYTLALNFMADWTLEERERYVRKGLRKRLGDDPPKSICKVELLKDLLQELSTTNLPPIVDHVKAGLTLPPGEQGTCGSCWAFAATGAIEGQIARHTGKHPVGLSEQNIMDCSWSEPYDNFACNGGLDYAAYGWAIEHNKGKIATEESYPFLNQDGFCHYDFKRHLFGHGAHAQPDVPGISECFHVSEAYRGEDKNLKNEELVKAFNLRLFTHGPLAVSIDASPHDFYFYFGGIYHNPDCKSDVLHLDHAVLAVGYNLTSSVPYTVVRNNWGRFWGEHGYARIAQTGNICGVATAATYVSLEGDTPHPTPGPTAPPTTLQPTTQAPSQSPTITRTGAPTFAPTTAKPSPQPSISPEIHSRPTGYPTLSPTPQSKAPTQAPSNSPTRGTTAPTSAAPTHSPTKPVTNSPVAPPPTDAPVPPPTSAPVVPPTDAPMPPPTSAPVVPPTDAPMPPPTSAPVVPPTDAPVPPPTSAPVVPPTDAPVPPPTSAPVVPPTEAPAPPPTSAPTVPPTSAPVVPPTSAPVVPPTSAPVVPPTESPVVPPTESPVVPPTESPVVPPTSAPVVPPTSAPVVPPTSAPVVPPTSAPVVPPSVAPS